MVTATASPACCHSKIHHRKRATLALGNGSTIAQESEMMVVRDCLWRDRRLLW